MKKYKKNQGFTLVELLATIVILALVVGITIFTATRYISSSKEKTYLASVTNIEKKANDYLLENNNRLFYISDDDASDIEYQCLTVQNLIDMGYFDELVLDSKVSADKNVNRKDYIYIERNKHTQAVVKNIYLKEGASSEYFNRCEIAVVALGDISFNVSPSLDTWSQSKQITIDYKLKNLNDVNTINNYTYDYQYGSANKTGTMKLDGIQEKITVNSKGELTANIKHLEEKIVSKNLTINKIDTTKPSIAIDKTQDDTSILERTLKLTITDSESGLKKGGVLEYGWSDSRTTEPTYTKANLNYQDGAKSTDYTIKKTGLNGVYYLWIKVNISDVAGNNLTYNNVYGGYKFIYKFMVNLNKGTGIESVSGAGEYIVGQPVTINATVSKFYKWSNWTGYTTNTNQTYTFIMPSHAITLTANAKAYKCSEGTLTDGGSKGYICVRGPYSYATENCYTYCWNCGFATGGAGDSYEECCATNCPINWTYYCPSGWPTYSGSGSSLKCYRNATTD